MKELEYERITMISEAIRTKKMSPVDLVKESLKRIEKLNPVLNAFITVTADEALSQAKIAEAEINTGNWKGPLHGIPVAIKDFFDTKDIRTTAAFIHFKDRIPTKDAVVIQRLKNAGAIIVGKTNMHELGMGTTSVKSYFGSVHNPWNPDYVAGGSSGGSAAAVAAGLCYATVDTDAVGSCRLPAACCGVTGFKPTFGSISGKGILEGEKTDEVILKLAHVSITTRSAEDTALLLNVLRDPSYSDQSFAALKNIRLGIVRNCEATKEVGNVFSNAIEALQRAGYAVVDVDAPFESATFSVKTIDEDRSKISSSLFRDVDALLLPTTTGPTPTIVEAGKTGDQAVSPNNTFFCNYFGLPAISIPCGFDENYLPLGLQIAGPIYADNVVLALSREFQKLTDWQFQHPTL